MVFSTNIYIMLNVS